MSNRATPGEDMAWAVWPGSEQVARANMVHIVLSDSGTHVAVAVGGGERGALIAEQGWTSGWGARKHCAAQNIRDALVEAKGGGDLDGAARLGPVKYAGSSQDVWFVPVAEGGQMVHLGKPDHVYQLRTFGHTTMAWPHSDDSAAHFVEVECLNYGSVIAEWGGNADEIRFELGQASEDAVQGQRRSNAVGEVQGALLAAQEEAIANGELGTNASGGLVAPVIIRCTDSAASWAIFEQVEWIKVQPETGPAVYAVSKCIMRMHEHEGTLSVPTHTFMAAFRRFAHEAGQEDHLRFRKDWHPAMSHATKETRIGPVEDTDVDIYGKDGKTGKNFMFKKKSSWPMNIDVHAKNFSLNAGKVESMMWRLGLSQDSTSEIELEGAMLKHDPWAEIWNWRTLAMVLVDSLAQAALVFFPACVFLFFALTAQVTYARSTGVVDPAAVHHGTLFGPELVDSDRFYGLSYVSIILSITLTTILAVNILIRMVVVSGILHGDPKEPKADDGKGLTAFLSSLVAVITSLLFFVALFMIGMYVVMVALWLLAGALIDPNKGLLPFTAVFGIVNAIKSTIDRMNELWQTFKSGLEANLNEAVKGAVDKFAEQNEVFEGDRAYEFPEFFRVATIVAKAMGSELTPGDADAMFSYADTDCSGQLTPEQLQLAFQWWEDKLVDEERVRLGVTDADIAKGALFVFGVLAVVYAFIIQVTALWGTEDVFATVVSTAITLSSSAAFTEGKGGQALRQAAD